MLHFFEQVPTLTQTKTISNKLNTIPSKKPKNAK